MCYCSNQDFKKPKLSKVARRRSKSQVHQDITDATHGVIVGRNLDAGTLPASNNNQQTSDHTWKFVIPNVKANQNLIIGMYSRAHELFAQVVEEVNSLHLSTAEVVAAEA